MSPELRLIFAAAAGDSLRSSLRAIENVIDTRVDWDLLVRLAAAHGVRPLTLKNLGAYLPEPWLSHLQAECAAIAAHNRFITGELLRILDKLETSGIPAIPFKGPALAIQLFGDVGLREFTDLDIIVPRVRAWEAVDVLCSDGYASTFAPRDWRREWLLGYDCELMLTHPGGFAVEVHWDFSPPTFPCPIRTPFGAPSTRIFSTMSIMGRPTRVLNMDDTLLFACGHLARHFPKSAKLIGEIANMLSLTGPPMQSTRTVQFALDLVRSIYGIPEMPAGDREIWLSRNRALCESILADPLLRRPNTIRALLFDLRFVPELKAKARHLHRIAGSPSAVDLQARSFPRSLFGIYYLAMLMRRIRKHSS